MSKAQPGLARRLATNTLHSSTGRFASLLVWMLLTPAILRTLGTEGFAVWSLFFAVTGYFNALDFGLSWGTVRHVAAAHERREPGSGGAYATLAVLGYLVLSIPWLLLGLTYREPLLDWLRIPEAARDATGFVMVAGAVAFACSGLANITISALQGCNRFDLANHVSLVVVLQQAIGIPVVLRAGWGLEGLVVNVGLGWLMGFAFGAWRLNSAVPEFRWEMPRDALAHVRATLRFGGPMQVTSIFAVLHSQFDKFLLSRFVSLAAVTPFELGLRVVVAAAAPEQVLVVALLPAASALHAVQNHERLRELHARANRYVLTVGFVTMAAVLGSAPRLYAVWLGPGHDTAALALRGLAIGVALTFTTNVAVMVARGIGRTDLEAWFAALVFAVHLGLSLLLIPRLGLMGALIATIVSNLVGGVFFAWIIAAALGWKVVPELFEPVIMPLLALATGGFASWILDRFLPITTGMLGWLGLGLVAAAGAFAALAVILGSGYVKLREVRDILVRPRPGAS